MKIIELTQYLLPDGRRTITSVAMPDNVAEMAQNQILSCEMLQTGMVAFYSYPKGGDPDEEEDCMIAENHAGENSPKNVLEKLIRKVALKWEPI